MGSRRAEGGWIPSRLLAMNGPSRWAPRIRGPPVSIGTPRRAARSSSSGAEMKVGVGGHPGLEHRLADPLIAPGVGSHQVDSGEPVDLEVDHPGGGDSRPLADPSP